MGNSIPKKMDKYTPAVSSYRFGTNAMHILVQGGITPEIPRENV
jgi:hypothetical protein